jgi:ribosomal protein L11 methylase PrmA
MSGEGYLLAERPSELGRPQLQSQVWEATGRQLLSRLGDGSGGRALDVGCRALGWLGILRAWAGPSGQVVGTDIDQGLLDAARLFPNAESRCFSGSSGLSRADDRVFDIDEPTIGSSSPA